MTCTILITPGASSSPRFMRSAAALQYGPDQIRSALSWPASGWVSFVLPDYCLSGMKPDQLELNIGRVSRRVISSPFFSKVSEPSSERSLPVVFSPARSWFALSPARWCGSIRFPPSHRSKDGDLGLKSARTMVGFRAFAREYLRADHGAEECPVGTRSEVSRTSPAFSPKDGARADFAPSREKAGFHLWG